MTALLRPKRPSPIALAVLVLAALATLVGGFLHARLFHRGYSHVDWVGFLFLLNGIAATVVVLALLVDRVRLFVLGSLFVNGASLVSILISHSSRFLGFGEGAYDPVAKVIVAAEVIGIVTALVGGAVAERRSTVAPAGAVTA